MPLSNTWFALSNTNSDLDNVLDFISELPTTFRQIISTETSNFNEIINRDSEAGLSYELFTASLNNAETTLKNSLISYRNNIEFNDYARNEANTFLSNIGFTGGALQLKTALLNKLWTRVVNATRITGFTTINYWVKKILEALKKLLKYLNSLLGSLEKLIPGIDPLKELKEVVESYIDDELGDE